MKTKASTMSTRTWESRIMSGGSTRGNWLGCLVPAAVLGLIFIKPSHAAEYGRSVTVGATLTMANVRPAHTLATNFLLVYVDEATWGACRTDAVVIKKDDTHLLAHFLTAQAAGKTIQFWVDDTLKPLGDDTCQVTMIKVFPLAGP